MHTQEGERAVSIASQHTTSSGRASGRASTQASTVSSAVCMAVRCRKMQLSSVHGCACGAAITNLPLHRLNNAEGNRTSHAIGPLLCACFACMCPLPPTTAHPVQRHPCRRPQSPMQATTPSCATRSHSASATTCLSRSVCFRAIFQNSILTSTGAERDAAALH